MFMIAYRMLKIYYNHVGDVLNYWLHESIISTFCIIKEIGTRRHGARIASLWNDETQIAFNSGARNIDSGWAWIVAFLRRYSQHRVLVFAIF